VRANGGPLPLDGVHRASNGSRKTYAILGVANIVIHGFRNGNHFHSLAVKFGGIAEGVISTDRHQVIESQHLDILQHRGSHVEHRAGHALLG
jgi:hypothetical protein